MSERLDELTGLLRPAFFEDRITHALTRTARTDLPLCVMVLEIGNLAQVRKESGEEVADMLVRAISQRVRGALRKVDTVARLDDDHLGVLAEDIKEASHGALVGRKVTDALSQPFHIGDVEVTPSISAGVAIAPFDGTTFEDLYSHATTARRTAMDEGGGYALFSPGLAG